MTGPDTSKVADVPEVKVPASISVNGMLRFDVSESQLDALYEQLTTDFDNAEDDKGIPLHIGMDKPALQAVNEGATELLDRQPTVGLKQIPLAEEPVYAVTVLVNTEQLSEIIDRTRDGLRNGDNDMNFSCEFPLSPKAAVIVIKQIEQALDGADSPVDAIDMKAIRETYS